MTRIFILFFFPLVLWAEVSERFSKNKANINEKVEYILSWDLQEKIQWNLPKKGLQLSQDKLPKFEIHKIDQFENEIRLSVSFFNSGSLGIPIEYSENNETKTTKAKIEILSNLTGQEKEIQAIEPPVEIKGNIWTRLLIFALIALIFAGLLWGICYWIFQLLKKRKSQKQELETIVNSFEKFRLQRENYKRQLSDFLSQEPILGKNLVFLLSDCLKAEISYLLKKDLFHLTEKELFEFLSKEYNLSKEMKEKWHPIFLRQKYCDIRLRFTKVEAKMYIEDWNRILNL